MSFPGGGHEPGDEDLLGTALREANEEIGLPSTEAEMVGRLGDIPTVTRYSVGPFVARVPDRRYVPDGREAAEAVEAVALPVADLMTRPTTASSAATTPLRRDTAPLLRGRRLYGPRAAGRMLAQLLILTTDWRPPPARDADSPA
jgi:ADP-ribose pyrophosphatase YjhB (NUDIX family)